MKPRQIIGLVPLDPVDPEILDHISSAISTFFSLSVQILPTKPLPSSSHHIVRNQHHSTQLLEYLLSCEAHCEFFRVLGITEVDLYIPIFTFVFGEAQLDGKAALISTFRPRGSASGIKAPQSILLNRLLKLSMHELGHTFGLPHCRQDGCLMGFAPNLEKLDQKNPKICKYCQILLDDYFNKNSI